MPSVRARVLHPESATATRWIPDAYVAWDAAGVLTHVSPWDGESVDRDLRNGVLTPGFVDAHVHFPQTRIVGAATGPLLDWLNRSTFPEEARFADTRHAAAVARVFVDQLARAGTTLAFAYGSVHPPACDALFAEVERRGLRVIGGPVLMDEHCPPELQLPAGRALAALEALVQQWHGRDGRIEVAAIPRFALCCSRELMAGAAELARRHGLWKSTHLSESRAECTIATERFAAADYLRIYEDLGLVDARSVYAHCIWLSDDEWSRFAAAGAVVAHCPDSNAFLGSGDMPTDVVRARGIPLAVGTDVAAGRSFRVPKTLAHAYDNGLRRGLQLEPAELLWWGTGGGARALGHPELGGIAVGRTADLVWHATPPWVETVDQALASVLFDADAPVVRATWVQGRVVWSDGRPDAVGGPR